MALIDREFMPARPVEIGRIKIGQRGRPRQTSGGGKSFIPEKLDYFLVTTMEREGSDGEGPFKRDEAVHADVGPRPRELLGWFMYPEVSQNLHTEMVEYSGRRRQWSCDGQRRIMRDKTEQPCQRAAGCNCKPFARLHIALEAAPQMGGFYCYRTTSWSSVNNLQSSLEQIHREFGTLYKAPIKLLMMLTEDTYMDGQQERTSRSWKVTALLNMSYQEAQRYMVDQALEASTTRQQLTLEAGAVVEDLDHTDVREEGELADEFRPPEGVEASVATNDKLDQALKEIQEREAEGGDAAEQGAGEGGDEASGESAESGEAIAGRVKKEGSPDSAEGEHPVVALLELARESKILTEKQLTKCASAIRDGEEGEMNITADWIEGKLVTHGVISKDEAGV